MPDPQWVMTMRGTPSFSHQASCSLIVVWPMSRLVSLSRLNPVSHRWGPDRMHDRERLNIYPGNFFDISNRQETTVGLLDRETSHLFPGFLNCIYGTERPFFKTKSVIWMRMRNHNGVRLKRF